MARTVLIFLSLVLLVVAHAEAAREIEPNNHWLQGTLIDGTEPVEGALNDEQDVYKLLLPETGEVTVVLDRFPDGTNLTLEVLGFRKDPIVPISKVKTRNDKKLTVVFDAQERLGYLAITATPTEKVCKDQWCIMRLVANGPYYLLKSGPTLPSSWNGQPIIDPPDYRLSIVQPEIIREQQQEHEAKLAFAGLPLFEESSYGLQFHYQPDWEVRAESARRIVVKPSRLAADNVQVVIGIRDKAVFPGSSSELQLNLAEKVLLDANAQIIKRGVMTVMQRPAPYLLGTYPYPGKQTAIAHLQLVLDVTDQYYWISYTAPTESYPAFTAGFATILKTLDIQPLDLQSVPGDNSRQ
ncbi:MAG TPA: hypothetical protein VJ995_10095 [Geothermobacteraceae bacterium]|nr:hypothetical protein [Geothermobacteraceae bacterium]